MLISDFQSDQASFVLCKSLDQKQRLKFMGLHQNKNIINEQERKSTKDLEKLRFAKQKKKIRKKTVGK